MGREPHRGRRHLVHPRWTDHPVAYRRCSAVWPGASTIGPVPGRGSAVAVTTHAGEAAVEPAFSIRSRVDR